MDFQKKLYPGENVKSACQIGKGMSLPNLRDVAANRYIYLIVQFTLANDTIAYPLPDSEHNVFLHIT